jgi:hypothetical protein
MLHLKEQIFGAKGFSSDLILSPEDLSIFHNEIQLQWLSVIQKHHPELYDEAEKLGIENYHLIVDRLDHQKLWPKSNRVLPQKSVKIIQNLSFISILRQEFGAFTISDVYDTHQHFGEPEIYWRLVRPHAQSDVGPLHKDKWFHGAFNSGYGMFADDEETVKVWIPICCESGKSGLALASGSHLKEWKYHIEVKDDVPRPVPDEDLSTAGAVLISTEPGNALIFNEGILHGGVINNSNKTRVSAEITLVIKKDNIKINNKNLHEAHINSM